MIKVAAAIIEKYNTVLAARRKPGTHLAGYWEFPGGKIEAGETPQQCLERELYEEFTIQSRIKDKVGENIHHYDEKTVCLIAYIAEHTGGEFDPKDHDQLSWLTLDQLDTVKWAPADIPLVDIYRASKSTQNFYQDNAQSYFTETLAMSMSEEQEQFVEQLPQGAHILDLGCGSGRDSKIFKDLGFTVTALDGSKALADKASEYLGQEVVVKQYQHLEYDREFDAVWACASLLHCPKTQLPDVLRRVIRALKPGGLLFMSFKHGETETIDHKGRYFNNVTEHSLAQVLQQIDQAYIQKIWAKEAELRGATQVWISGFVRAVEIETAHFPHKPLSIGGDDPFLPALLDAINHANEIYIAAAFIRPSGLKLIFDSLIDAAKNGLTVKILTGDYLYVTDPVALRQLMFLQEHGAQVKVFQSEQSQSFHMKAYLFIRRHQFGLVQGCAFIGSSNITRSALTTGLEWNLSIDRKEDEYRFDHIVEAFHKLFDDERCIELDHQWIDRYAETFASQKNKIKALSIGDDEDEEPPEPNHIQETALDALQSTRAEGFRRGLVVMATGLGKTWLAAFDSVACDAQKVLFVAHREEILDQAEKTFIKIRPTAKVGRYSSKKREVDVDMLFASVQTLGRDRHLENFAQEHFDYIVVDEFHHAAAQTYRHLLAHFKPKFMLGLTATPERTDQVDILNLCDNNLVYSKDLFDGIEQQILCPFTYYGFYDEEVNYQEIKWRNGKFDPKELHAQLATQNRAIHNFKFWELHRQKRTLAFCISKLHADFMANHFNNQGIKSISVHSESEVRRSEALELLEKGKVDVIFSVDLFNEGVDLPCIDTVLMLRPTESAIIFLQQLGRGLRTAEGKDRLVVLDFIGNHISFLRKIDGLFNVGINNMAIKDFVGDYESRSLKLPDGCFVNFDVEVIDFMKKLCQTKIDVQIGLYQDLKALFGRRPTLAEFYRAGGVLNKVRGDFDSWFGLVKNQGDLTEDELTCICEHGKFFSEIETTHTTKSYKIVTLDAMLELDGFSQPPTLQALAYQSWDIIQRRRQLLQDLPKEYEGIAELPDGLKGEWLKHWKVNPIKAWSKNSKTKVKLFFDVVDDRFVYSGAVVSELLATFESMLQEMVDYGYLKYLQTKSTKASDSTAEIKPLKRKDEQHILYFSDLKIACGHFTGSPHSTEQIEQRLLPIETYGKLDPGKHFIARAQGDSMDGGEAPIKDGDYLLLERVSSWQEADLDGAIVAVERSDTVEGEQYLLRKAKLNKANQYELLAKNEKYAAMPLGAETRVIAKFNRKL